MAFPLFLIPIIAGLTAQGLKFFFNKNRRFFQKTEEGYLPRYGGMPSAHTAFVFSLATLVAVIDGFASTSFAVAAALAIFVMDDALRMRIFLGYHGQAIFRLVTRLPVEEQKGYPTLETHLGHKPAEVTVGALLGTFMTLAILFYLHHHTALLP
jgi:acid phosphatase family membrane protein YuiD